MGPFPIQDLHTDEPKGTEPPTLPERGGLGPSHERAPIFPRERATHADVFYLGLSCANSATEAVSSRLIHQPFRVRAITTSGDNTLASAATAAIFAAQTDLAGLAAADGFANGLVRGPFEGAQGAQQRFSPDNSQILVGSVVRAVPTRLHLVVTNGSGGALEYACTVAVEYLAAMEPTPSREP